MMHQLRTQPAGPKAFHLYATVRDAYRQELGERTFAVYAALTYYVDPKTLRGAIPLKLLAQTIHSCPATISRHLHKLGQLGLVTITPQWDAFGCVRDVNVYNLDAVPLSAVPLSAVPFRRLGMATATVPARRQPGHRCAVLPFPGLTHNRPQVSAQSF